MRDYFEKLLDNLQKKEMNIEWEKFENNVNINVKSLYGYSLSNDVAEIYSKYKVFELNWSSNDKKYKGFVNFVPYQQIEIEHRNLVNIMEECYDVEEDDLEIKEDIINWYPLFKFPNGDCFCLDARNGKIVFYEHELYDMGVNLHGLVIGLSVDDLFQKWSQCYFVDLYDWYEGTNESGIDIQKSIFRELL